MAKKKVSKKKTVSKKKATPKKKTIQRKTETPTLKNNKLGLAIVALVLNILVPGLGTIISGKIKEGVWQIVLLCIGLILLVVVVGYFIIIAVWLWAIISGIKFIKNSL